MIRMANFSPNDCVFPTNDGYDYKPKQNLMYELPF